MNKETELNIQKTHITTSNNPNNINVPQKPKKIIEIEGTIKITCANCEYIFTKAPRCPECGQLIDYEETTLNGFHKMVEFVQSVFAVGLKYDHIQNPTLKYDKDICYWFGIDKQHKLGYLYYHEGGRVTYASFEPDPKYLEEEYDTSGFYRVHNRDAWPQLKLFYKDYNQAKNNISALCAMLKVTYERNK